MRRRSRDRRPRGVGSPTHPRTRAARSPPSPRTILPRGSVRVECPRGSDGSSPPRASRAGMPAELSRLRSMHGENRLPTVAVAQFEGEDHPVEFARVDSQPRLPEQHGADHPRIDGAPVQPVEFLADGIHQPIAPSADAVDHPEEERVEERGRLHGLVVSDHRTRVLPLQGVHREFAGHSPAEDSGMDAGAIQGVRDPRRIAGDREAGSRERGQIVSRRNRTRDGLRPPVHVDAELAAKIHRGGVRVDVASGADVHRIALREYPRVTSLVRLSDVEEEELRFQERHVLAAESVLVRADPLEATDEARLTGDEARRPVGADDDARIDRLAVCLDSPPAIMTGNPRDLGRRAQLRAIVDRAIDEPAIECGAMDRVSREAGDVEPSPVRRDALGTDDALGDPLLSGPEAVRRKAELADAFRALDWFADHLLLFEDRGPEARGGEWPCGHPSGRSSADDDRVVHSTRERGSELFRPYAVASAGNRTARSSPCAVGRYTYGGTPRRTAGPRCFVISWTAIRTRRPLTVVYSERPSSSATSIVLASGWRCRNRRIVTVLRSNASAVCFASGRGSSSNRSYTRLPCSDGDTTTFNNAVFSISSSCFATAAGAMPIWAASSGIFESRLRYTLFSTTIERTSR